MTLNDLESLTEFPEYIAIGAWTHVFYVLSELVLSPTTTTGIDIST